MTNTAWIMLGIAAAIIAIIAFMSWRGYRTMAGTAPPKVACKSDDDLYRRVMEATTGRYKSGGIIAQSNMPKSSEVTSLADMVRGYQGKMPEQFVKRPLTPAEIAELDDYPLPEALAHMPNIGGIGNPQYEGPHYDSMQGVQPRFVPYDVLADPLPGTAVHIVGDAACVGPLPIGKGPKDAE